MDSDDDLDLAAVEVVMDTEETTAGSAAPLAAPAVRPADGDVLMITAQPAAASSTGVFDVSKRDSRAQMVAYLASNPRRMLNLAFLGFTRHGKTALVRRAFGAPTPGSSDRDDEVRGFTTQNRVHAAVVKGVEHSSSLLATVVDTPGEPSFAADASAGMTLAQSVVFCVDAAEGLHPAAARQLGRAVEEGASIIVAITKLDTLVVQLRLPPRDAYRHLRAIVDKVNAVIAAAGGLALSVTAGDVLFLSTEYDLCLSLPGVAAAYVAEHGGPLSAAALAKRFWGTAAYNPETRCFVKDAPPGVDPSFVEFVLTPVYKVFAETLQGRDTFASAQHHDTAHAAVRDAMSASFGAFTTSFIDALLRRLPVAADSPPTRVGRTIATWSEASAAGSAQVRLVCPAPVQIDLGGSAPLGTFVRVEKGSLSVGESVLVCNGKDDVFAATVESIAVRTTHAAVALPQAGPGVVAMVTGLSAVARPGVSVVLHEEDEIPTVPLAPRAVTGQVPVKVAIEPVKPQSSTALREALQKATSLHASCRMHVEDTGDHVIVGSSELYLDTVLHAVRSRFCGKVHPLRLTDPSVNFCETVIAAPRGMLRTASNEHGVSMAMVAAPASKDLAAAFDEGTLSMAMLREQLETALVSKHGWDELEAAGLLAVGPDPHHGASFLIDDTLGKDFGGSDVDPPREALRAIADGFRSTAKRGPLCGETLRGVKVYVTSLTLPPGRLSQKVLTSITALSRQLVRAAVLSAAPRILEPILAVEVITRPAHSTTAQQVLQRRRGGLAGEVKVAATPLVRLNCVVPAVDSFGLDAELRLKTGDQVLATFSLAHWSLVPGDPLDDSATLLPLQAASGAQLARDFMLKTRRAKGLMDNVEII